MTIERHKFLMESDDAPLTEEERQQGYHFCGEFDGLLRTNVGEGFQCDCLNPQETA